MQVVCGNCQLSFQAPDGATGLVCPICRSPLRAPDAPAEPEAGTTHQIVDWNGGTLDDLISLLSGPAWSARVEVLPANGGNAAGEVHVIAGGVSEAIFDGKSTHDALDRLRALKGVRFRIETRLPNPGDGDLTFPGPESGKLEERPLAHLMRYCEDYVLTAGIEVWRASENAKVDYRRGEIVGVTVGGIDAPERLAEVMKWSSGNYRLIVPRLSLPETAPKAAAPAPAVVAPKAAAATAAASKTIFGMPALDPGVISAAVKAGQVPAQTKPPGAAAPHPSTPGVPTTPVRGPASSASSVVAAASAASDSKQSTASPKTIFGVQASTVAPPAAAIPSSAAPAPIASAAKAAAPAATAAETPKPGRPTATAAQPAQTARLTAATTAMSTTAAESDKTVQTKTPKQKPSETPVWTYVGVGFIFGLALLGVYRLVIVLAH